MTRFSTCKIDGLVWYIVQQWDRWYKIQTVEENPGYVFAITRLSCHGNVFLL